MGQICLLGHLPDCLMWMARVVHHRNQSEKILVSAMNYKEVTVRESLSCEMRDTNLASSEGIGFAAAL